LHSCSLRRMMRRWRRMSCKRWSGAGRTASNAGARCAGESAESATTARRCGRAHGVEQRPDAGRGRALCAPGATFGKLSVKSGFCPETGPGAPRGPEGRRRRLGQPHPDWWECSAWEDMSLAGVRERSCEALRTAHAPGVALRSVSGRPPTLCNPSRENEGELL
jgi:hypothetical protein